MKSITVTHVKQGLPRAFPVFVGHASELEKVLKGKSGFNAGSGTTAGDSFEIQ